MFSAVCHKYDCQRGQSFSTRLFDLEREIQIHVGIGAAAKVNPTKAVASERQDRTVRKARAQSFRRSGQLECVTCRSAVFLHRPRYRANALTFSLRM